MKHWGDFCKVESNEQCSKDALHISALCWIVQLYNPQSWKPIGISQPLFISSSESTNFVLAILSNLVGAVPKTKFLKLTRNPKIYPYWSRIWRTRRINQTNNSRGHGSWTCIIEPRISWKSSLFFVAPRMPGTNQRHPVYRKVYPTMWSHMIWSFEKPSVNQQKDMGVSMAMGISQ